MEIHDPSTSNYDIDVGALPITERFNASLFELWASNFIAPPLSETIFLNGTGRFNAKGENATAFLTPRKKHRLRLINTSANQFFQFSLDQH